MSPPNAMRTLLLCAIPFLIAFPFQMTSSLDAAADTPRPQTPDTIRVVNATDQPLYFIYMPARSARPLRQEMPLSLNAPPPEYLEPGREAPLRGVTCANRDRLTGDTLLLYRIGAPDDDERATAILSSKRTFTPDVLSTLADQNCRMVIDSLDESS